MSKNKNTPIIFFIDTSAPTLTLSHTMTGRKGRSGRPRDPRLLAGYVPIQVRLAPAEAIKFDLALVRHAIRTRGNEHAITRTQFFTQAALDLIELEKVTDADVTDEALAAMRVTRRPRA